MNANRELFTIGHSNHTIEAFIELLQQHGIAVLADVRSHPYSRHLPHFTASALKAALVEAKIRYVFLGKELGARPNNPNCYVEGKALYEKIAATEEFSGGIQRLMKGIQGYKIALMCAEKDPMTCHRTILICQNLREYDLNINHILSNGKLESQQELELRLLKKYGLDDQQFLQPIQLSLFSEVNTASISIINSSLEDRLQEAYQRQSEQIAYQEKMNQQINIYTIGFTKKSAQRFFELLIKNKVKRIIDARLNNNSQLAGFTKKVDFEYFLDKIANIEYTHILELAPTPEILDTYKKNGGNWETYEQQFLALMQKRQIETQFSPDIFDSGCILCSEATPQKCHRRLVAEYLSSKWDNVNVQHL